MVKITTLVAERDPKLLELLSSIGSLGTVSYLCFRLLCVWRFHYRVLSGLNCYLNSAGMQCGVAYTLVFTARSGACRIPIYYSNNSK